jgi:Ca2+-binding EF-hand superfamily protein
MAAADLDKNGHIDYSEFINATINKRKLLSKERLKTAFQLFDRVTKTFSISNFYGYTSSL